MTDRKKLREAAEAALAVRGPFDGKNHHSSRFSEFAALHPEYGALYRLANPKAIIALLDELDLQDPVSVKPLEWRGEYAQSIVGIYRVESFENGTVWGLDGIRANHLAPCENAMEAKAAAQADYEARIRSALAPSPAIGRETVTEEMVERAAFAAWASTTPFAGRTEAEFRTSADQVLVADLDGDTTLEHDMLLDWEMNKPTFCVLARAALEAALGAKR